MKLAWEWYAKWQTQLKMNYSKTITGLFCFLLALSMAAQQKWSLDDCVTYALQHNLQLNDFKYNEQSDRETYRQSIRNLLPSVNGATNYVVNFGRSTDPFTNDVVTY